MIILRSWFNANTNYFRYDGRFTELYDIVLYWARWQFELFGDDYFRQNEALLPQDPHFTHYLLHRKSSIYALAQYM